MNAQLPEHMTRVTIKDMIVGEQAYTVPWSIQVDQDGKCWIRGDYAFTHRKFGTSKMSIKRASNGFEVQVSQDTQYEQVYISPETRSRMALLPVVKISSTSPEPLEEHASITQPVHEPSTADE